MQISADSGDKDMTTGVSDTPKYENMTNPPPPFYRQLDAINDDFHCIRRTMNRAGVCFMEVPEIMGLLRMSIEHLHSRYEGLAFAMRAKESNEPTDQQIRAAVAELVTPERKMLVGRVVDALRSVEFDDLASELCLAFKLPPRMIASKQ